MHPASESPYCYYDVDDAAGPVRLTHSATWYEYCVCSSSGRCHFMAVSAHEMCDLPLSRGIVRVREFYHVLPCAQLFSFQAMLHRVAIRNILKHAEMCNSISMRALSTSTNGTQRPISPHVTIYKFPIAAMSSIANRASACVLSAGMFYIYK